jgi:hypothetical protein
VGATRAGPAQALAIEVTLYVLAFLELAQGAGLSLDQVAIMAGGGTPGLVTPPIRLPSQGVELAQTERGVARLSPIAARAQLARVRQAMGAPAPDRQEGDGPPQAGGTRSTASSRAHG